MKLFATYKRISKRSGRALWGVAKRTKHIASIAMVALLQHKHAPNWAFHSEQDSYSCANSCLDAENNVGSWPSGNAGSNVQTEENMHLEVLKIAIFTMEAKVG